MDNYLKIGSNYLLNLNEENETNLHLKIVLYMMNGMTAIISLEFIVLIVL